jgi:rRNA pseudouridine-1189 N-methylase Emg1 (Nep1/Mra1 family)
MTNDNSEKTLIVFDTNKLQNTLDGEFDYSTFEPKGDLKRLKEFIVKNNLQDKILIGLSEVVLGEYCNHRNKDFKIKLDQFRRLCSKMKNVEDAI